MKKWGQIPENIFHPLKNGGNASDVQGAHPYQNPLYEQKARAHMAYGSSWAHMKPGRSYMTQDNF